LKTSYFVLIIFFLCFSLGFFFFPERILFFLYGYEQSLIKAETAESFMAFKMIAFGRRIFLVVNILLSFGLFVSSNFARKKLLGVNKQIVLLFLYISFMVFIIFLTFFVLSFIIPTRII